MFSDHLVSLMMYFKTHLISVGSKLIFICKMRYALKLWEILNTTLYKGGACNGLDFGSNLLTDWKLSVWSMLVLSVPAWLLFWSSNFLRDMQIWSAGYSKLVIDLNVSINSCSSLS